MEKISMAETTAAFIADSFTHYSASRNDPKPKADTHTCNTRLGAHIKFELDYSKSYRTN